VAPKFDALKPVRNGMWVSKVGRKYGLLSTKADEGGNFAESVLECQNTVLAIGARECAMQPPPCYRNKNFCCCQQTLFLYL
ncbi:MAG: hypothetical protein ACIWVG_13545, partial [Gloeotrichia echinulata HAB0833]